jgi:hypothetical protein
MNGDPEPSDRHEDDEAYVGLDINDMVHDFGEGVGVDMRDFGVGVEHHDDVGGGGVNGLADIELRGMKQEVGIGE